MPSATSKSTMAGTKRKSAPVKDHHTKESKKPKTSLEVRPVSKSKDKPTSKSKPAPKREDSSDSASEDSDSDGGVPLDTESSVSDEEVQNEPAEATNASEGLHPDRAKAVATNGQSSRESHQKQKQLVKERKAAKPLADDLARTKKLWERLRRKSHVPKEERDKLVAELFQIVTGRIKDYVLKHDSVRVVQTAIKYATPEQKRMIAKELSGTYCQLAESKYAKFLIGKLLVQGDNEIRDLIVPEFYGHVRRLIKHPEASWILDDVYRGVATKQQKAIILREWYGAEFALFRKDNTEKVTGELSEILAAESGKRGPIMRSLLELINHLIQKKMTGFTLLHDAMLQYLLNTKPGSEEITDYLELIKGDEEGDLLKNLAFTKSGSRVVSLALAYGTAKDRKQILKTYKDTLQMMAGDAHGHVVILTAYEVIDDTVLTAKSIFPELLSKDADKQIENIVFSANDLNARTTLLYLFQGRSKSLFPASHASDLELLAEIDKIRQSTSKKDPETRRSELAKALSPYLLRAIEAAAPDLVATSFGSQFITEILFGADGDKSAALEAVARTASGDPAKAQEVEVADGAEPALHLANTPWGGKMLKSLIAGGRFDPATKTVLPVDPALNFAGILYPYIRDSLVKWATGASSFVVLALVESNTFSDREEVLEVLRKNKKVLSKAATEETPEQKARREEEDVKSGGGVKEKGKAKGKKAKGGKEREVGNKGAKILLEKL